MATTKNHNQSTDQEAVGLALEVFFRELNKSMKSMQMYLHQQERFPNFLRPAYLAFRQVLDNVGTTTIKVEQTGFKYRGKKVYTEPVSDQNIAFLLHQEGARLIKFHPGLEQSELLEFVKICLNARINKNLADDLLSQIWNLNLRCIEYIVMESYALGGASEECPSEEDLENEVDQIVEHIYDSLTTGNKEDQIRFARVSVEDLGIELQNIQQARGIRLGETTISPQLVARFQDEITHEEEYRLLPKLLRVVLTTCAEDFDVKIENALNQSLVLFLDFFLLREDFAGIQTMLSALSKLRSQKENVGWQRLFSRVRDKMSDHERIHRVGEIVETTNQKDNIQAAATYLNHLDSISFTPLLQSLETLNRPEARELFCNALVRIGHDRLDELEKMLDSPKANFVRDIISILEKIQPPNMVEMIARLLDHKNLALRIEALKIVAKTNNQQAAALLEERLADSELQIRLLAAELLAYTSPERAESRILAIVQQPQFADMGEPEQTGWYSALISTQSLPALQHIRTLLHDRRILVKRKSEERQKILIKSLVKSGSITAYNLLRAELKRGFGNTSIDAAATRACEQLKKKLLAS